MQLLVRLLDSIALSRSTVPEQQHYGGGLRLSDKEPGVQRVRNTWKKSFMNSFSCGIADIKLFRQSQKTCSFSESGYPSLVSESSRSGVSSSGKLQHVSHRKLHTSAFPGHYIRTSGSQYVLGNNCIQSNMLALLLLFSRHLYLIIL